jgi:hypothetical protein
MERKNKYIPPKLSGLVSHIRPSKLFLVWVGDGYGLEASVTIDAGIKNNFFLPPAGVDLWAEPPPPSGPGNKGQFVGPAALQLCRRHLAKTHTHTHTHKCAGAPHF